MGWALNSSWLRLVEDLTYRGLGMPPGQPLLDELLTAEVAA
jgi:hypothetical protein